MALDLPRTPTSPSRRRGFLFRRRFRGRGRTVGGYRTTSLRDPRAAIGSDRRVLYRPKRRLPVIDILLVLSFAGVGLFLVLQAWQATRVPVEVVGITDGDALTIAEATSLRIEVRIERHDSVASANFTVNGEVPTGDVLDATATGFVWTPPPLDEGRYELGLTAPRPVLADASFSWTFDVDGTAPTIGVPPPEPTGICSEVSVGGLVEPGATLTADGQPVDLDEDGSFTLSFDQPPAAPVQLIATDPAGNRSGAEINIPVAYPANQGVHVTAAAWGHPQLRADVLELVDKGLVSTVELDLKDEGGIVGYDTDVALAHTVGAVQDLFDLDEAVKTLTDRNVRVIGRVVAFRDPPLATWAWEHGRPDMVVQTAGGDMLGAYGGFTNFVHPDVRQYNLDIALEGVQAGMDDILWDYVRRPEGAVSEMVFPGIEGSVTSEVTEFLAFTGSTLRLECVYQGASVFGIAADRPHAVGQDVGLIARHVDYIAPMVYPSHWVSGEYGVEDPELQPYDIVKSALADFQAKADDTGVAMVPWIQDFSLRHPYGPDEVRAQIDASADLGVSDWLLWNATVVYTDEALEPSLLGT